MTNYKYPWDLGIIQHILWFYHKKVPCGLNCISASYKLEDAYLMEALEELWLHCIVIDWHGLKTHWLYFDRILKLKEVSYTSEIKNTVRQNCWILNSDVLISKSVPPQ